MLLRGEGQVSSGWHRAPKTYHVNCTRRSWPLSRRELRLGPPYGSLKADHGVIFRISSAASKAADFILSFSTKELEEPQTEAA
jgi:hypothetical protein